MISATKAGEEACQRYHQIRQSVLVKPVVATGLPNAALSELGALLRTLSGHYDQAARAATSL